MQIYPNPGFQGPSSLKTVLDDLGNHLVDRSSIDSSTQSSPKGNYSSRDAVLQADSRKLIDDGVQLLDSFLNYLAEDGIRQLFSDSKGENEGLEAHLGGFLVYPFFDSLVGEVDSIRRSPLNRRATLVSLSRRLFEKAGDRVEIHAGMSLADFSAQYTGANLRWETIGLIITLAGSVKGRLYQLHTA